MRKSFFVLVISLLSVCTNAQVGVHLSCPDDKHPHAIDLGLPSGYKWACCNLGAEKPKEYGIYYDSFPSENSTKNSNILSNVKLAEGWEIPLEDLFDELRQYCKQTWNIIDDVEGCIFTSKENGNNIFIPFGGRVLKKVQEDLNWNGWYWSKDNNYRALSYIITEASGERRTYLKSFGLLSIPIRAVYKSRSDDISTLDQLSQNPSFPGGNAKFAEWMGENVKYPEEAIKKNIQGKVYVTFTVEKDGTISNVILSKGINKLLDDEALRLVKSMPKWIPGKDKNGNPVIVPFTLPLTFKPQ